MIDISLKQVLLATIPFFLVSSSFSAEKSETSDAPVLDIGSRLKLFIDDYIIDHLGEKAKLRLHHPEPKGIAIVHDAPWEGNVCGHHSIFKDGDLYRMYYRASQIGRNSRFWCYTESDDGIHWRKPELGLYEFEGSKANNIVFPKCMGIEDRGKDTPVSVFKDENPNVSPDERYKAICGFETKGLYAFKSADGIQWTPMSLKPVITDGAFDSQNLAFWDSERGEYRAYWRFYDEETDKNCWKGVRSIRTATSKDFIHWEDQTDLRYVDSLREHMYTNVIKPYYRAPHIFIGFPVRYIDRGWSESMKALPELQDRERRSTGIEERAGTALTESLLMASHDGVTFKRWNEAFLRPGIERKGTWNYGQQFIAWSMLETESALEGAPNELSLYAMENKWTGTRSDLRRYTLRIDGFVSVSAPMDGGELVTKPLNFTGDKLVLNFSSSAAGDIQVEILDKNSQPIPGFTLKDSPPIFGDSIERIVSWKGGKELSSLHGQAIRLRFVLKDADLYSFQFIK